VRVYEGVEVPGRFISDLAYAAYARGAEHEAREEYSAGLDAYLEAAARDPASVEVWTRIGALRCRLERHEGAAEAFVEAESIDDDYEPVWRERALCAERRGDAGAATAAAARAVELDPEREQTVLLYARLLEAQGEGARAGRWLRDLARSSPHDVSVWQALHEHARRSDDAPWARHAAAQLRVLAARLSQPHTEASTRSPWAPVDEALLQGDRSAARRHARQAGFHPRLLAVRAIVLGRADLALAEAELRVDAEPTDTDSRIALALAADLTGQRERTSRRLGALPAVATAPTALGEIMLGELLLRHVSAEAAQAWLGQPLVAPTVGDSDLRQRLRALLQSEGGKP
ncbi:MAG: tetratricopeptide repeat protein, partial [Deltaproteobacteria bacterium]|nr:tetratricopeptide repeat protein [Deltaproteobacteria bacterium]